MRKQHVDLQTRGWGSSVSIARDQSDATKSTCKNEKACALCLARWAARSQ